MDKPIVRKYGSNGILREWKAEISPEIHEEVIRATNYLEVNYAEEIVEIVPSYHSLLIFLKKSENVQEYIDIFRYVDISISTNSNTSKNRTWKIPVCYHSSFGSDLIQLSEQLELSPDEIIGLHTAPTYRIYAMGFLPGFLYLGGLDTRIHCPRKEKIAPSVSKGSVAIGGEQTGIYPQNSPGGWHVIGRTPIELFDVKQDPPSPFTVGDSVQFYSVDLNEFELIESLINAGKYQLKSVNND